MLSPWTRECSQGLKWAGTTLNGAWHTVFLLAKGNNSVSSMEEKNVDVRSFYF